MTIDIESTNGDQRWSIMIHLSLKLKPLRPLSVGPHISDRDVECVSRVRPGSDASHPKTHPSLALKRCIYRCLRSFTQTTPLPPPQKKNTESLKQILDITPPPSFGCGYVPTSYSCYNSQLEFFTPQNFQNGNCLNWKVKNLQNNTCKNPRC